MRTETRPEASLLEGAWEANQGGKAISVQQIGAGVYRVWGHAVSDPLREAPNIGLFDVIAKGSGRRIELSDTSAFATLRISVTLEGQQLQVTDTTDIGYFGMGVTFSGSYVRVGEAQGPPEFNY